MVIARDYQWLSLNKWFALSTSLAEAPAEVSTEVPTEVPTAVPTYLPSDSQVYYHEWIV